MPFARICATCSDVLMVKTRKKAEGTICFLCSSLKKIANMPPKVKKSSKSKSKIKDSSQITIGSPLRKNAAPELCPVAEKRMIDQWLKRNEVKTA